jgi:hypothetical protein
MLRAYVELAKAEFRRYSSYPLAVLAGVFTVRGEVAAALIHRPRLLVLHEPTIGLDLISKERLRHFLVAELAERGTTLLLATHDMGRRGSVSECSSSIMVGWSSTGRFRGWLRRSRCSGRPGRARRPDSAGAQDRGHCSYVVCPAPGTWHPRTAMKYLDLRAAIRRRFPPSVGRRATSLHQASEPVTRPNDTRPHRPRGTTRGVAAIDRRPSSPGLTD